MPACDACVARALLPATVGATEQSGGENERFSNDA